MKHLKTKQICKGEYPVAIPKMNNKSETASFLFFKYQYLQKPAFNEFWKPGNTVQFFFRKGTNCGRIKKTLLEIYKKSPNILDRVQSMSATSVERVSSPNHFAELQLNGIEPATLHKCNTYRA